MAEGVGFEPTERVRASLSLKKPYFKLFFTMLNDSEK